MKQLFIIFISAMAFSLQAQTMKLIPVHAGMKAGTCHFENAKKQQLMCYALEYTPNASGVLTSYTTGFFVSCTSLGMPVAKNLSCSMTDNVSVINGCESNGLVLLSASGNSGNPNNNWIKAGEPVILHQICFSIPMGESITIREDPVTDLTTSIDLENEDLLTEYPVFEEVVIKKIRPDISRPSFLDFKGIPAGSNISQLDWSTPVEVTTSHFIVERSADGKEFSEIGRVESSQSTGRISSYQFFDKNAATGKNFYRLQQVDVDGKIKMSPVRHVTFSEKPFSVKVSPNPANEFIIVEIQSPGNESVIKLYDPSGRVVLDEKNEGKFLKTRLDVSGLLAGQYTLTVETSNDKFSENVVILH
jgi:hypothetical protein